MKEGKKALDAQIAERDKQLKDLQAKAGDNEELKQQINPFRTPIKRRKRIQG